DQAFVVGDAAFFVRQAGRRPQVMVAWSPDDPRKTRSEGLEYELEMRRRFPRVAADDQPIFWMRRQRLDRVAVLGVSHVEVADRPKVHAVPRGTTSPTRRGVVGPW